MYQDNAPCIGFVCAYTPLVLIDAAGFSPYRLLPCGSWPDQAGHLLHDNLCPHVKRLLDRVLERDLPELSGMIFTTSCDAMRRAADAWQRLQPNVPAFMIDLPATFDESAVRFLGGEFNRLAQRLQDWGGKKIGAAQIESSLGIYNTVADQLEQLRRRVRQRKLKGGRPRLQELYNLASTQGLAASEAGLGVVLSEPPAEDAAGGGVPVYLFGNVLADAEVYSLLESCGAGIVGDDFCTGDRMFAPLNIETSDDICRELARCVLSQPPCARTFDCSLPGKMAADILARAKACKARGVIGHTLKFCDPYMARLPYVRDAFSKAGVPLLLLEGDCTLRSIGQQRTRIEAFIEMLR